MKTFPCMAALVLAASAAAGAFPAWAHGTDAHAAPDASRPALSPVQKDWGLAGDGQHALRTITLTMTDDMRFTPDHFQVKRGETVRLRVVNQGQVMHEAVLGTRDSLDAHAQMMLKYPGMEHAEPYMAHVAPDQTEELVWNFNRAGSFDFACLIAGHYQAGMQGRFTVTE